MPEPEPVAEEQEIVSEPVIEEPAAAEPAAESKGGSAVDVSASIISNFAKMFTREHKKEDVPEVPEESDAEPVTALGNGGKTIEGVVADVIRGIIGKEVLENWRRGADYDAYAREEICRQTNQWLNANLPAIVERTVKQEIERVMAKVGSEQ
ncbi:unknown [Proteobacteria bacterium CAG:495]|nr:unknown [Proteobacteria bacterium CAG:495]